MLRRPATNNGGPVKGNDMSVRTLIIAGALALTVAMAGAQVVLLQGEFDES
jgi:hypothetical protein